MDYCLPGSFTHGIFQARVLIRYRKRKFLESTHNIHNSDSKASAYNVGDPGSTPGSGRSPGEGKGNLCQDSCPENPMDRETGGLGFIGLHRVRHD